jgi:redox-sensitive bicupin YhaK (pirin superfamily)
LYITSDCPIGWAIHGPEEYSMSWNPAIEPTCPDCGDLDGIETIIIPRARDLGGFEVRRALPSPQRQMVGPFIFFDQAGPAEFITGTGIDVWPHPHIGLATVTYLYKGEFQHRDSLGTDQMIYPGEVNWMIAGKGVTHSERTSAATRTQPHALFGIQTWVALPDADEDVDAGFEHHDKQALPLLESEGKQVRLIIGNAYGERAPVKTFSEMFYADAVLQAGARLPMPDNHEDRGIYVVTGSIEIAGEVFESGRMMVFRPGDQITVKAGENGARLMLLGGETLNGPRYIWWNFVASSRDKIEHAKEAWRQGDWERGHFQLPPGDTDEFMLLPDTR